jgi:hypothetical protein
MQYGLVKCGSYRLVTVICSNCEWEMLITNTVSFRRLHWLKQGGKHGMTSHVKCWQHSSNGKPAQGNRKTNRAPVISTKVHFVCAVPPFHADQHLPRTMASRAIRTYMPHSACRKYAALGSESNSGLISKTRGKGCMTTILRFARVISCGVIINNPHACDKKQKWPLCQYNRTNRTHCCVQFVTVNSLYMLCALICWSSGGTVCTAVGMFCVCYVGWLLAGYNMHAIYQLLYIQHLLKMSKLLLATCTDC